MATMPPMRILVADDQQDVLTALRMLLKNDGMQVTTVSSPAGCSRPCARNPSTSRSST